LNRSPKHKEEIGELISGRVFEIISYIEREREEHGPFCDDMLDLIEELTDDINGTAMGEQWNG